MVVGTSIKLRGAFYRTISSWVTTLPPRGRASKYGYSLDFDSVGVFAAMGIVSGTKQSLWHRSCFDLLPEAM